MTSMIKKKMKLGRAFWNIDESLDCTSRHLLNLPKAMLHLPCLLSLTPPGGPMVEHLMEHPAPEPSLPETNIFPQN